MPAMGYQVSRPMKRSDIKTVYHFASNSSASERLIFVKLKYHNDISLIYIVLNVHINSHMIEDITCTFRPFFYTGSVTWGWMSSEFFLMSLR